MARMAHNLENSHMFCESVNVTMKTTIDFYHMTNLRYFVIKEKLWVDMRNSISDVGNWTIFCVSGGYWAIILRKCGLFWVGGGGCGVILFEWEWVGCTGHTGHCFRWVGFSGGGWNIVSGGWRCVEKYFGWIGVSWDKRRLVGSGGPLFYNALKHCMPT